MKKEAYLEEIKQQKQREDSDSDPGAEPPSSTWDQALVNQVMKMPMVESTLFAMWWDLKRAWWTIHEEISDDYDFGLVSLDTREAKSLICTKLEELWNGLSNEVVTEFLDKMRDAYGRFKEVEDKITVTYHEVDDIVDQIEFVKVLKQDEGVIERMAARIGEIREKKQFIDSLEIQLESDDFMKYLALYTYANDLRELIDKKDRELESERQRILKLLQKDIEALEAQSNDLFARLESFKDLGLQTFKELKEVYKRGDAPKEAIKAYKEVKHGGQKLESDDLVLNPIYNEEKLIILEKLEFEMNEFQERVAVVHSRQKRLRLKEWNSTTYEQAQLYLKHFMDLWTTTVNYTKYKKEWSTLHLNDIDSDKMLDMTNSWSISITQLTRFYVISDNEKPRKHLKFLQAEL